MSARAAKTGRTVRTIIQEPAPAAPAPQSILNMQSDFPADRNGSIQEFQQPAPPSPPAPKSIMFEESDPFNTDFMREEAELSALMAELGTESYSEGFVNISEKTVQGRGWSFVERVTAAELSAEGLPKIASYGAGTYMLTIYAGGGTGIRAKKVVTISDKAAKRYVAIPVAAPAAPVSGDLMEIRETVRALAQLVAQSHQQQKNPKAEMLEMLTMMKAMREAFGGVPVAPANPLEHLRDVIDLAQDLNPPTDGSPALINTLSKFADKFGPMIGSWVEKAAAQNPPAPARQIAQPGPAAPPDQTAVQSNEGEVMFQNTMVKYFMATLIESAAKGADPISYAGQILDHVPRATVEEWITAPSLMDKLAELDPRVRNFPGWFDSLREEIVALLREEAEARDPATQP